VARSGVAPVEKNTTPATDKSIADNTKATQKKSDNTPKIETAKNATLNGSIKDGYIKSDNIVIEPIAKIEKGKMENVSGIVIHRTDGYNAEGAKDAFKDPKKVVGAHFIIDKDGKIYQTASLEQRTNHVGELQAKCETKINNTCSAEEKKAIKLIKQNKGWAKVITKQEKEKNYPDRYPNNSDSIGIEFAGKCLDKENGIWEPVTAAQEEAGRQLMEFLKKEYKLGNKDIYAHDDIGRKVANEGRDVLHAMGYEHNGNEWTPKPEQKT